MLLTSIVSPLSGQVDTARAVVSGLVRSKADTTTPIPGVEVVIEGARERELTDSQGRFRFVNVPPGRYELRARRIGYAQQLKIVTVGPNEHAVRIIDMDVVPQRLTEVRIAGRRMLVADRYRDAYRRAAWGFGNFIFREDIERRNPMDTKAMLDGIPGVFVNNRGVYFQRCSGPSTKVQVYIDGQLATRMMDVNTVLESVHPLDIELIEVYRGVARIPAECLTDACAVIVIWTRS